jgi:hypothetical protein
MRLRHQWKLTKSYHAAFRVHKLALVGILTTVFQSGCAKGASLDITATALAKTADECLADVRDREMTFEKSPSCSSLRTIAAQHTKAGGFREDNPCKYALLEEQAGAKAWMALAMSEAGHPKLRIW